MYYTTGFNASPWLCCSPDLTHCTSTDFPVSHQRSSWFVVLNETVCQVQPQSSLSLLTVAAHMHSLSLNPLWRDQTCVDVSLSVLRHACVAVYDAHVSLRTASGGMAGHGKGAGLDVLVKDGCGWKSLGLGVYHAPSCTTHPVAHKNPSDLCRTGMCVDRAKRLRMR